MMAGKLTDKDKEAIMLEIMQKNLDNNPHPTYKQGMIEMTKEEITTEVDSWVKIEKKLSKRK